MTDAQTYIAAIRKAIEAGPTPGEWNYSRPNNYVTGFYGSPNVRIIVAVEEKRLTKWQANLAYIASCNPVAISAVLSEIDRLKAENERVQRDEAKLRGQGMAIAAGILVKGLGEETYATEIMGAAGYKSVADLEADGVDEYDINILRPLFETAALKGGANDHR